MLIDTHCHVHFNAYKEDSDEVIRRAFNNGVKMIIVGTDAGTSEGAVALAGKYDGIWAAIGMHPNHAYSLHHDESELSEPKNKLERFDYKFYKNLALSSDRVVAIGECGLDFYRIPAELNAQEIKAKQVEIFKEHINLATELNLPLIIHVREAHKETIETLRLEINKGNLPKKGVIHCFTSNWEDAKKYLDLGFMISFTGTIAFPPRKGQPDISAEVVRNTPLENILIETDSPYLAPPPHRGERNEPSYVKFVAERIAAIKGLDFEEVADSVSGNAVRFFNLPLK